MKIKKYKSIILIIIGLSTIGLFYFLNSKSFISNKNIEPYKNNSSKNNKDNEEITLDISMVTDCAYATTEEIYKAADVVVIGKYLSDEKVEMIPKARPYTTSKFEIQKIIKNSTNAKLDSKINVRYGGGTLSLEEYMKDRDNVDYQKMGISDLTTEQQRKATVKFSAKNTTDASLSEKQERVLFINYEPEKEGFIAICDYYGMISYDSQKNTAYDISTNTLKSHSFLK